jgi:hypothetical protein
MTRTIYIIYGSVLCVLLGVSSARGWLLYSTLNPFGGPETHEGVRYHGNTTGYAHK